MAFDARTLLKMGDIRDLPRRQMHMVLSIRICGISMKNRQCPLDILAVRFGSIAAAKAVMDLSQMVGKIWPENFMISRPCCSILTPDEMLLSNLMDAVLRADNDAFTAYSRDMLSKEDYTSLHSMMANFCGELEPVMHTNNL